MKTKYTEAFIEQALTKIYSRGDRSVQSVADDLNVKYHTIKNWMKRNVVEKIGVTAIKEKRPQDWSNEEQLVALHETHGLSGENLHSWCREWGWQGFCLAGKNSQKCLFNHNLTSWKAAFCAMDKAAPGTGEIRTLKAENENLKRELLRKEKALAEAAALLILQKKFRALWEGEVK